MTENPAKTLEEKFFEIEKQFLACPLDRDCTLLCSQKVRVGDHQWFYSPNCDYLGSEYEGVVVVGGNPALPKNREWNPVVRESILSFLASSSTANARNMNHATEGFIPYWGITKSNTFNYEEWGLPLRKIAYVNAYKCRTVGNFNAFSKPKLLFPCLSRYLLPQMALLQAKLVIYLWKTIPNTLERLGVDPTFGEEYCFFNGQRNLPKAPQHRAIRERVERAMGRLELRHSGEEDSSLRETRREVQTLSSVRKTRPSVQSGRTHFALKKGPATDLVQSFLKDLSDRGYIFDRRPLQNGESFWYEGERVIRLLDRPTFPNELIVPVAIYRQARGLADFKRKVWRNTQAWSIELTKENYQEVLEGYVSALQSM